jgi:hypothetical protein
LAVLAVRVVFETGGKASVGGTPARRQRTRQQPNPASIEFAGRVGGLAVVAVDSVRIRDLEAMTDPSGPVYLRSGRRNADWFAPACSAVSRVFDDVLPSGIAEGRELKTKKLLKTKTLEVLVDAIEQRLKDLSPPSVTIDVMAEHRVDATAIGQFPVSAVSLK